MNKLIHSEVIERLIEVWGDKCQYPDCKRPFTDEDPRTIDHHNPKDNGGTDEFENLRIMHRTCNSKKGNAVPDENGVFVPRVGKPAKPPRPELCDHCMSGRLLLENEICDLCGSEPQPKTFPKYRQRKPKNCEHNGETHCWMCIIWPELIGNK